MVTKLDVKRPLARVLLADPDALARRAIRDGLDEPHDFVVIAEARDGVEVAELAAHYRPELVVIETVLPRVDGITAMEGILAEAPDTRVVMLTAARNADVGLAALRAGASGVLGKDIGVDGVIEALRAVLRGEIVTSPAMTRRLVEHLRAHAGVRDRHAAGQERAQLARVGGPGPAHRRALHGRHRG
jgi:DNA-binding NarL/FixJ family response regulator